MTWTTVEILQREINALEIKQRIAFARNRIWSTADRQRERKLRLLRYDLAELRRKAQS